MSLYKLLIAFTTVLTVSHASLAASVNYTYDQKGQVNEVASITGIELESSWRCKIEKDTSASCPCGTAVYSGLIAQIEYETGGTTPEGIVMETQEGAEHIVIASKNLRELGSADRGWINRLIRKGEHVVVIADICGATGRGVYARDIFRRSLFDNTGVTRR